MWAPSSLNREPEAQRDEAPNKSSSRAGVTPVVELPRPCEDRTVLPPRPESAWPTAGFGSTEPSCFSEQMADSQAVAEAEGHSAELLSPQKAQGVTRWCFCGAEPWLGSRARQTHRGSQSAARAVYFPQSCIFMCL